jgi:hypothetical protein
MRLLRVDGTVLLTPARLVGGSPPVPRSTVPTTRPAGAQPGSALAEAARLLQENDEVLGGRR